MNESDKQLREPIRSRDRAAALLVHIFTASGAAVCSFTVAAILRSDYRTAFLLMALTSIIDAVDGTFARRLRVREVLPEIDGRKLDDIVDYMNYTFAPILLLCHAGWLPEPAWGWASIPLITSLFGFAHTGAKEEDAGYFRGFPSYWNIVVFYIAVWLYQFGPLFILCLVLLLSLLTVVNVRFVYPNRPPCWNGFFLGGGVAWLAVMLVMFWQYPVVSSPLLVISLIYPVLYILLSIYLDVSDRVRRAHD